MANINRRQFLNGVGATGFLAGSGVLGALSAQQAFAADVTGYKALVCIFLKGGMDHADTVLPYDPTSFDALSGHRVGLYNAYNSQTTGTGEPLRLRERTNLSRLTLQNADAFNGREFALPPESSALAALFDQQEIAVVGSVGPLIEPTTRASMSAGTVALPPRLFSHNDQQSTWMAMGVEGAQLGWGGGFAAAAAASGTGEGTFSAITTAGQDVFLSSEAVRPYRVGRNGGSSVNILSSQWRLGRGEAENEARAKLEAYLGSEGLSSSNLFEQDYINANARGLANTRTFSQAFETAELFEDDENPENNLFPDTQLGRQLRTVAQTISIHQQLNVSRQVFYVSIGGYDTHDSQAEDIPALHTALSEALVAFRQAMVQIGEWNNVTAFTASDFGRTIIDNGNGTDHGWGGHHFVLGGSVNGGRIYGDMPGFDLDGADAQSYTESRGRLIPSTSVDQYAATLGRWFGLDNTELNSNLVNLSNFLEQDLGFMGGTNPA